MPDSLRSKTIRLAASLPKDSQERKALLNVLAGGKLQCDMRENCQNPVTHIGNKGWTYCAKHSKDRKGYERTRKMTKAEIKKLESGGQISYSRK